MNTKIIGYLPGTFDLFHIGHLNIIKKARKECDFLIIGLNTDNICEKMKNKTPVIPFIERKDILSSLKYVDKVVEQDTEDRFEMWQKYQFNKIFVGDDWKDSQKWNELEKKFKVVNVELKYFKYTKTTSSTIIRAKLK